MAGNSGESRVSVVDSLEQILTLLKDRRCGPLPNGVLIIPHDLARTSLQRLAGPTERAALAGWRMLTAMEASIEVLRDAGTAVNLEATFCSPYAIEGLFASRQLEGRLGYFEPNQLRNGSGYAEAFASTLGMLESSGLTPAHVLAASQKSVLPKRLEDIHTIWSLVRAANLPDGPPQILRRAVEVLTRNAGAWGFPGPVVAWLEWPTPVEMAFLKALPDCRPVMLRTRPFRQQYKDLLDRIGRAFGDPNLAAAMAAPFPEPQELRDIDVMRRFAFENPAIVSAKRKVAAQPDQTVQLALYASVEDELENAAQWVIREVVEHGTPLDEVAILLPAADPLAGMLVERLRGAFNPQDGGIPVFVAGGLPARQFVTACRIDTILAALDDNLSADSLHRVLPTLLEMTVARAGDMVYSCGTTGGTPGNADGGLTWIPALSQRLRQARQDLAELKNAGPEDGLEPRKQARGLKDLERLAKSLEEAVPVVTELQKLYGLVRQGSPLAALWPALCEFLDRHLRRVPADPGIPKLLGDAVTPLLNVSSVAALTGRAAIGVLRRVLADLRVPCGRYGEPRVFIGTIDQARWLGFTAVRIVGLCEGNLPSNVREDTVLPDTERTVLAQINSGEVPRAGNEVLRQLQSFHRALRSARARLILSAPREWVDGNVREVSAILIEVANTVSRTGSITSLGELHRDYLAPMAAWERAFARAMPVTRQARHRLALESRFAAERRVPDLSMDDIRPAGALSTGAIHALLNETGRPITVPAPADGKSLPGLSPDRPISASRLAHLLSCPYMFVLKDLLYRDEPFEPPSFDEIDPLPYGSLLHTVMEAFYNRHGAEFGQLPAEGGDDGSLWRQRAETVAREVWDRFLPSYPLAGKATQDSQYQRLLRDVRTLVDFGRSRRPFEVSGTELAFGYDEPCELDLGAGLKLYVGGYIDRLERAGEGGCRIWDIKSGRLSPINNGNPLTPKNDIQLAVYLLAFETFRGRRHLPPAAEVCFLSPQDRGTRVRGATELKLAELRETAQQWLHVAVRLLAGGQFPYAVKKEQCQYCGFSALCPNDIRDRSKAHLTALDPEEPARQFLTLDGVPEPPAENAAGPRPRAGRRAAAEAPTGPAAQAAKPPSKSRAKKPKNT